MPASAGACTVAIDPQTTAEPLAASPIENELATYRAISPMAVFAFLLGLVSFLTFADLWFLIASGLAVAAGLYADRRIRKLPDILTGRKIAQAGVALGIISGLAAVTISFVSTWMIRREAAAFGREFAAALESQDLANAVYLKMPYSERKKMTPPEALKKMEELTKDPAMYMTQTGPIQEIQRRLKAGGDAHVRFVGVEAVGFDRLVPVAGLLLEVHGPPMKGHEPEEYALIEAKGDPNSRGHWWASELYYPYKRESYAVQTKGPAGHEGHVH